MSTLVVTTSIYLGDKLQSKTEARIPLPEISVPLPSLPKLKIPAIPSFDLGIDLPNGIPKPPIPSFGISIPAPSLPIPKVPKIPSFDLGLDAPEGITLPAVPKFGISIPLSSLPLQKIPALPKIPTIDDFTLPFGFSFAGKIPRVEITSRIE